MYSKPDFKSYLRRQIFFKKYQWIIRSKDGYLYEEVNGLRHSKILAIIEYFSLGAIYCYIIIKFFDYQYIWIFASLGLIFAVFVVEMFVRRILYRLCKFQIIDEERLKEFPGIKL